jgi:phosphoglycerate dehydrogenase-like enzyme
VHPGNRAVADRFAQLPNVILTPHSAVRTVDVRRVSGHIAAEAVLAALNGKEPVGLVNPEAWPGYAASLG